MKKALLILDPQKGFLKKRDFKKTMANIHIMISDFKKWKDLIIAFKHIDKLETSPIYYKISDAEISNDIEIEVDYIVSKTKPNAFYGTQLEQILKEHAIDHLFITGFNTEFCCLFTAISGYDRGYKVTFIEDATNTINSGENYGINQIDIPDFIGYILHWSETVETLDFADYEEIYRSRLN